MEKMNDEEIETIKVRNPLQNHLNYHIALQPNPVNFQPNKGKVFYDETNRQLILISETHLTRINAPKDETPIKRYRFLF